MFPIKGEVECAAALQSSLIQGCFFFANEADHSIGRLMPGSSLNLTMDEIKQFAGYDTTPGSGGSIEANRKRAVALLEEAGVPRGFRIALLARSDIPAFRDSSINVAAQLKTIGLDATVDVRDAGGFYAAETSGQFQRVAHSVGLSGSRPDQILGEASAVATTACGRTAQSMLPTGRNWRNLTQFKKLIRDFQLNFLKTYYQINLAWVGYGGAHAKLFKG